MDILYTPSSLCRGASDLVPRFRLLLVRHTAIGVGNIEDWFPSVYEAIGVRARYKLLKRPLTQQLCNAYDGEEILAE